jgi:cyclase
MKHRIALGMLIAIGAMSIGASAPQAQSEPRIIAVDRVKDNLYVLRGGGGHTVLFITTTGLVIVDTMNPGWGQTILETIKTLTDKPVTALINTHAHADHVSGNVVFPATVDIIVQRNTKKNMQKMTPDSTATARRPARTIFEANGGRGLATRTFRNRMTLGKGADEIDLYYFGRGHTNSDTWVVFPALGVVDMGDLFPDKTIPLIDAKNGGSAYDIGGTLAKGYNKIKNVDGPEGVHRVQLGIPRRYVEGGASGKDRRLADPCEIYGLHTSGPNPGEEQRRAGVQGNRRSEPPFVLDPAAVRIRRRTAADTAG